MPEENNYHSFMYIGSSPATGIIVPQQVYEDRTPYQPDSLPVRFPGPLYLTDALNSHFPNNPQYEERPATSAPDRLRLKFRILWPAYAPWECNINVRERDSQAQPVPLWVLAHRVATEIRRFSQSAVPLLDSDWSFSKIAFDRLILHELRQVSSGSWQAVILYDAQ
ncbi:hypothetical protein PHLGIDRAFT_119020 [Phlebiopsis gigantea 11061_1 CR5-6]|uniref:Uncharacterized protein n=1 Tax=Phlebiopsis gigantea (strain 11061_1 CR5-6) TaxID=745531 RepID=A0A0C3RX91_PHLG1|nr:hypothetical protein PHLGIDRAFT_119020 [Phlebiopsis gigantea 11061_1 CR5-6]